MNTIRLPALARSSASPGPVGKSATPNRFRALRLGALALGLAVAAAAAWSRPQTATGATPTKIAVIEFSPEEKASGMTHEAKRQMQASMAKALHTVDGYKRFHVVDVRHTRDASAAELAAINGAASTAAAVKVGQRLGVSYVLTGTVVEYTPKAADGHGYVTLKSRLVEVATGEVKYAAETREQSTRAMNTGGAAEMQAMAIKPAIEKITAALAALKL